MQTQSKAKYYPTAFVMYLTYFIHGIGAAVLGQQAIKEVLVAQWGYSDIAANIGVVTMVSAALGLGRLITLPFAGPMSDKLGRKICTLIGTICYAGFFLGLAFSPSMGVAYAAAILGGVANSFLDCGVIPEEVEIMSPRTGLATMGTKLFIAGGQKVLPLLVGFIVGTVGLESAHTHTVLYGLAIAVVAIGVVSFLLPSISADNASAAQKSGKKTSLIEDIKSAKWSIESFALIIIGFTCTATFQLWLNCAQTFAKDVVGVADPSGMQSLYANGTILAIILTAVFTMKIKSVRFLFIYPAVSLAALILVNIMRTESMCNIGAFLLGFFAAGGVLQLATATVNDLFPKFKGTITSIIMIASSLSNYTILSAAGKMSAPAVMMMNIVITAIGVALALFVNVRYGTLLKKAEE
ncbi:MAG: MFS transporter [Lachnospiraceae bacterium]|nr:MFS transporter [Lachnospiraceae bacterium]